MNFPPKIVDLKTSEINENLSDPNRGRYVFKKKVYIDYHGVKSARPLFRFAWCYNDPYAIEDWKQKWPGTDFLKAGDQYWPEGGNPNADGNFVYKDVVLMKIPVVAYLEQRKREITKSEFAPKAIQKSLQGEYAAAGVDMTEEQIASLLGINK